MWENEVDDDCIEDIWLDLFFDALFLRNKCLLVEGWKRLTFSVYVTRKKKTEIKRIKKRKRGTAIHIQLMLVVLHYRSQPSWRGFQIAISHDFSRSWNLVNDESVLSQNNVWQQLSSENVNVSAPILSPDPLLLDSLYWRFGLRIIYPKRKEIRNKITRHKCLKSNALHRKIN